MPLKPTEGEIQGVEGKESVNAKQRNTHIKGCIHNYTSGFTPSN